ncbi:MAG: hypothetical protein WC852_02605 [Candidatus Nanoarchaeia archaeon]
MNNETMQENNNLPFSQQDRELAWKRMIAKSKNPKAVHRLESKWDEGLPFSRQDRERAWKHMISLGRKENKANIPALP